MKTFSDVTQELICQAVVEEFKVSREQLMAPARRASIARPRMVAMYLASKHTLASSQQIALFYKRADHTTALYATKRVIELAERDPLFHECIVTIENRLGVSPTIKLARQTAQAVTAAFERVLIAKAEADPEEFLRTVADTWGIKTNV